MTDDLTPLRMVRRPTATHPLAGLTVLAVEDSRLASEALRLLCLRSGARIRRADCIASAHRHLSTYRPQVMLVDLGLPDGDGLDLIAECAAADVPPPVLLAMSGDTAAETSATSAGAQGFLAKPLGSIAEFQAAILERLPDEARPTGPRRVETDEIIPDTFALRDDLAHAAIVLRESASERRMDYAAQFVGSVARSARDAALGEAAQLLAKARKAGRGAEEAHGRLVRAVADRLAQRPAI